MWMRARHASGNCSEPGGARAVASTARDRASKKRKELIVADRNRLGSGNAAQSLIDTVAPTSKRMVGPPQRACGVHGSDIRHVTPLSAALRQQSIAHPLAANQALTFSTMRLGTLVVSTTSSHGVPVWNAASPWASEEDQLAELFECRNTALVTTRTATLHGFPEDPQRHQVGRGRPFMSLDRCG